MPIFDYKCPHCNKKSVNVFVKHYKDKVKCTRCGAFMCKLVSSFKANAHVFPADGVYLEHVSPQGKTFKSKKEMVRYANKNNLDLGYLL